MNNNKKINTLSSNILCKYRKTRRTCCHLWAAYPGSLFQQLFFIHIACPVGTSLSLLFEKSLWISRCPHVSALQEAPAAGVKNTLKMIETFLLWNWDRGKTKPLHGACNNRERFNSTSPRAAKRAWQWKSTNWGRTRKKWKTGKAWLLAAQKRNYFIWWAEIQGKLRLLWALWTKHSSFAEAPGPSDASAWVSWGSQRHKILQENALENKCLQSR